MIKQATQCRACPGGLKPVFSLGSIYPSAFTPTPDPPSGWLKVPLNLMECQMCGLVQLEHTFEPDNMYRDYYYQSGINPTMREALRDVVKEAVAAVDLKSGDLVVDIGCNDGTLLGFYPEYVAGIERVGFDPALNLAEKARRHCEVFINDYFGPNLGKKKARVITAIAMFYDLENIEAFMQSVLTWLSDDGVFVIQMTDLLSMIELSAFDNICHEHLEYWSLKSLLSLLRRFKLSAFRVEHNTVNGGSLRVFCCHNGAREPDASVAEYLAGEAWACKAWGLFEREKFATVIMLREFCRVQTNKGRLIVGLGASTKGNTLLQVAGLTAKDIAYIGELSPAKFAYYTIGSWIPIRPEGWVIGQNPDAAIVLPWHFLDGFKKKLPGLKLIPTLPPASLRQALNG